MFSDAAHSATRGIVSKRVVIIGQVRRRSLYVFPFGWHRVPAMTALRELRLTADLFQNKFAALIEVPVHTFRMWVAGCGRFRLTCFYDRRRPDKRTCGTSNACRSIDSHASSVCTNAR